MRYGALFFFDQVDKIAGMAFVADKQEQTMPHPPRKIIIDTDPGQDDAFAILLALGSPEDIEVLGIVGGGGQCAVGADPEEQPG